MEQPLNILLTIFLIWGNVAQWHEGPNFPLPKGHETFVNRDGSEAGAISGLDVLGIPDEAMRILGRFASYYRYSFRASAEGGIADGELKLGRGHSGAVYLRRQRLWLIMSSGPTLDWKSELKSFLQYRNLSFDLAKTRALSVSNNRSYFEFLGHRIALGKDWYKESETNASPEYDPRYIYDHEQGKVDVRGFRSYSAAVSQLERFGFIVRIDRAGHATVTKGAASRRGFILFGPGAVLVVVNSLDASPQLISRSAELGKFLYKQMTPR